MSSPPFSAARQPASNLFFLIGNTALQPALMSSPPFSAARQPAGNLFFLIGNTVLQPALPAGPPFSVIRESYMKNSILINKFKVWLQYVINMIC